MKLSKYSKNDLKKKMEISEKKKNNGKSKNKVKCNRPSVMNYWIIFYG